MSRRPDSSSALRLCAAPQLLRKGQTHSRECDHNIITRDAGSARGASVSVVKGDGVVSDVTAHLGHSGTDLGYRAGNGLDTTIVNDNKIAWLANLLANYRLTGSDSIDQLCYNEGVWGALGCFVRPEKQDS